MIALFTACAWASCLAVWAFVFWKVTPHSLAWIPLIVAAPPLLFRRPWIVFTSAFLLLAFAVVGSFSVGVFYVPPVIFLFIAAVLASRRTRS